MKNEHTKRLGLGVLNLALMGVNLLYVYATPFPWLIPLHVVFVFLNGLTAWEYFTSKRD